MDGPRRRRYVPATRARDRRGAAWWRGAVIYQIYPRSFQDSDGDGIGDLAGALDRLDHVAALGADAVWLSPFYRSPMADFGYDVADHTAVDPVFGTLDDADRLLAGAHRLGLKVIVDLVANHTSDRHRWFLEARSSRAAARRDWYLWHDPGRDGGPPNNWLSEFGGSAWQWDAATGQYYLHTYLAQQPDLNWRNRQVREAMHDVMRFWLDRGVDGFRVDAAHHLIKDDGLRDNPSNPAFRAGMAPHRRLLRRYTTDRPEVQDVIAGMRRVLDAYPGRVLLGEVNLPVDRLVRYYGRGLGGFHLPLNAHLVDTAWTPEAVAGLVARYLAALPAGAWPNWVLGNHDWPRVASRLGPGQARVAAMLLLTLRGTPTLYYGDEIGMRNATIPPGRVRDPWERNAPGLGLGRDPARAPMAWDAGRHAGFSTAEPWLPLAPDWQSDNVARQAREPGSMLSLYRALIALRRAEAALRMGRLVPAAAGDGVLAFVRAWRRRRLVVALNMTGEPRRVTLPELDGGGRILLSTRLDGVRDIGPGELDLQGDEGAIVEPAPGSRLPVG